MKAAFYAGLLLCIVVVADLILWIVVSTKDVSFGQAKLLYLNHFPSFLRNATLLTLLGVALSGLSIYFLNRSQKLPSIVYHRAEQILTSLNIVLISWKVFTLL
jgi:hypothetical protein